MNLPSNSRRAPWCPHEHLTPAQITERAVLEARMRAGLLVPYDELHELLRIAAAMPA